RASGLARKIAAARGHVDYVCFWHKADIDFDAEHVCFRGKSGHDEPLLTNLDFVSTRPKMQAPGASKKSDLDGTHCIAPHCEQTSRWAGSTCGDRRLVSLLDPTTIHRPSYANSAFFGIHTFK